MERLNCPDNMYAFKNCVLLNTPLFLKDPGRFNSKTRYCAKIGRFYYNVDHNNALTKTQIMMNVYQRRETSIDEAEKVEVEPYNDVVVRCEKLQNLVVEISVHNEKKTIVNIENEPFVNMLRDYLIDTKIVLADKQKILFKNIDSTTLVLNIMTNKKGPCIVDKTTNIILKEGNVNIAIAEKNALFKTSLNLVDLGVGGLDAEFSEMFRRAFSSRMLKPETVKNLGIKHIRGILLHGPPGCGKTLIARQICKMINSVEPKIINGPELLNKYVGQSEENMRNLFLEAEAEYKKKGENSRLHVIVFDEIDSICKARGSTSNGTGVNDSIVNQLLTKFDGVNECNNFLIIGMTNRPDMLDEALLRPGRFELQLQISLPDETGRQQILQIHTKKLRDTNRLGPEVSIDEYAVKTKNFTGAEIEGLVNSARSYAIERATDFDSKDKNITIDEDKIVVTKDDFDLALTEIKPKFGLDVSVKDQMSRYGVIMYSDEFQHFYEEIDHDVMNFTESYNSQMVCFMSGSVGSGRTTLALDTAIKTNYPFIKYVTGKSVIGMTEAGKCNFIKACFDDAEKSPQSVLIFDDMENIIDWVYADITGVARFSQSVCSTLRSLINYHHVGKRLIIFTFDDESLNHISRVKILSKPDRQYDIPTSDINSAVQDQLRTVNHKINQSIMSDTSRKKTSKDGILNIDQSLPIKRYIFEFNNIMLDFD